MATKRKTKDKKRPSRAVKAGTSKAAAAHRKAQFVEAYCTNGGNATQAAIAAGYAPNSAGRHADRLVKDGEIVKQIKRRRAETLAVAEEAAQLTANEVMISLARDLRFDPAKLYNANGSLKKISDMDVDTRLCLRGAEIDEIKVAGKVTGYTSKVKFPEKTAAREQGMKHFGLYKEDNAQQAPPPAVSITVVAVKPRRNG